MKIFPILALTLMITSILSACGARVPQVTPTVGAVDLQSTAAAAAFTVIAETQSAIPTATLPPTATVTYTPLPTLTSIPLPSSDVPLSPVPTGNSGGEDPCIHKVLPDTLQGEPIRIRLDNSTKAVVSVTVYLNQTGPQSVCGYRSYTLASGEFILINDLVEGCYTLWAWNPDPDDYFIATNGTSCLDDSATWAFDISTSSIKLNP